VQIILWGQLVGEAGVLPDPCRWGTLHGSEVYLTVVGTRSGLTLEGFLIIKKKKKEKRKKEEESGRRFRKGGKEEFLTYLSWPLMQ